MDVVQGLKLEEVSAPQADLPGRIPNPSHGIFNELKSNPRERCGKEV